MRDAGHPETPRTYRSNKKHIYKIVSKFYEIRLTIHLAAVSYKFEFTVKPQINFCLEILKLKNRTRVILYALRLIPHRHSINFVT